MAMIGRERKGNLAPALAAAAVLHAGLFAAFLVFAPKGDREMIVSSVPVTILSDAPATAPTPELDIPEAAPDQPEVAEEEATPPPPPPAPPEPAPTPKPPKPKPTPTPVKPPPAKSRTTPQVNDNWLDNVASGPAKPRRSASPRPADAPVKQENRAGGAPRAGPLSLTGRASLALISRQIARNWALDCARSDLADIKPVFRFRLTSDGRLVGRPEYVRGDPDPGQANARRAEAAMRQTEPFDDVTDDLVGPTLQLTFDAAKACRDR
ncbi:MAG: hypothetical protein K1X35_08215 [Caulobacteraceae bacterium]|nr:hypothetical protein [Caulobacteraceae bacterium]